ncbi:MAG: HEAT repeat domain-containing protein [Chloroflexi bacterium]|nr:HEAT repeat domain-containing protein [Chloroflexota bacterium]
MIELALTLQAEPAAVRWQTLVQLNKATSQPTDATTLSVLTKALADEHAFVRWQAGLALANQASGRQKLAELLKNYPTPPVEFTPVEAELKTDLICAAAIDALAGKKSVEAKEYLAKPLSHGDAFLRQSAVEAIGKQGLVEALPQLVAALKDRDPWVRRAAAIGLGHMGNVSVAGRLIDCLQDKAVIVRRSAAYALGALRAEAALPVLKISLTDSDPQVRRNAAWALGRIGRPEMIAELTRLLDDPDLNGAVAVAASEAIAVLTKPRWRQLVAGLGQRFQREGALA